MTDLSAPVLLLAIPGSLRRGSHNLAVVRAAARLAPPAVSVSVFDQLHTIPVFNEDLEGLGEPPGVSDLRRALADTDGLLISTPEYNQSVPGGVKNLIDWLSRGETHEGLAGRPVALTGATTGPWGTRIAQTQLRQMLTSAGALTLPHPMLFISHVDTLIDRSGELVDPDTLERLGELVAALAEWTHLLAPVRA